MADADIDAVALFRPKSAEKLKPFLDLDEEGDEDDEDDEGLYAEALEDGSFLVFTFQPYAAFRADEGAARAWLAQFGEALPEIHEDARGLLFFPDSYEPDGRTYDAVVAEVESQGVWMALEGDEHHDLAGQLAALGLPPGVDVAQLEQLAGQLMGHPSLKAQGGDEEHDVAGQLAALGLPGVDVAQLEQLAGQLMGDPSKMGGAMPFELGKLFEGMPRQFLDALGPQGQDAHADHHDATGGDDAGVPKDEAPVTPKAKPSK